MHFLQFFDNGEYCLTSLPPEHKPFYGILSHRWGAAGDEITYEEVMDGTRRSINQSNRGRLGFRKLQFCQKRAAEDGLRYFWVDTCCIDKQNPRELSYALNSMFHWYQQAARCYVYLSDVSCVTREEAVQNMMFESSKWFSRGWTLQELLAPGSVVFYSQQGTRIGDKKSLAHMIGQITGIPVKALRGISPLSMFSVEERFRWTKGRQTTQPEDMAYCLLGIFNVSMAPVYADGEPESLRRNAIKKLKSKIEVEEAPEEVIVIGGASWSDLSALDDVSLQELDMEIRSYTRWLLQQGQPPSKRSLQEMSTNAGIRLRELLGRFHVHYNDDSGLYGKITTWEEPWDRFQHHQSSFERVRGFLDNRWWMSNGLEDCHTGIIAAKTLLSLILWRDLKDLR